MLVALLLLGLMPRLAAVALVGDRQLAFEWAALVPSILAGQGHSYYHVTPDDSIIVPEFVHAPRAALPSAYMPPAYSYGLAGVGLAAGIGTTGVLLAEVLQALLGAATCLLVYQIALLKFTPRVALIAAVVFAVYPLAVYASSQISTATLAVFLSCALLWCLLRCERDDRARDYTFAGLSLGALMLARAETLLFVPFYLLWLRLVRPHGFYRNALRLVLPAVLVVSPWLVRNWAVFGRPTPLTVSVGINLWEGHNPQASGTRSEYVNPPGVIPLPIIAAIAALPLTRDYEVKIDSLFARAALAAIREDPWRSVRLALRKFMFYWGYYWGIDLTYPAARSPAYWLPWFLLLPGFAIGLVATRRDPRRYALLYIHLGLSTLIVMVFFVIPRYNLFVLPIVIPFAVHGYDLLRRLPRRLIAGRVAP